MCVCGTGIVALTVSVPVLLLVITLPSIISAHEWYMQFKVSLIDLSGVFLSHINFVGC